MKKLNTGMVVKMPSNDPEYKKKYYQLHRDELIQKASEWRLRNKERKNASTRKLREQAVQEGTCTQCHKPHDAETKMCAACKDKARKWHAKNRAKINARAVEYRRLHREETNKREHERRAGFILKGLCPVCYGKNPAREGSNICEECYQKKRDDDIERRITFKETGLCIRCAKNPVKDKKTTCDECDKKHDKHRLQAIKVGLCSICHIRPRGKTLMCPKCHENNTKKNHRNTNSQLIQFNRAQKSAKGDNRHRQKEWNISYEEYCGLINEHSVCAYCGAVPNGKLHGLDRVDNNQDYLLDNVVPCCTRCNLMKREQSVEDFLEHINIINNYQERVIFHLLFDFHAQITMSLYY